MAKYFLTCAIDYATADPHQGHAFEKIGADAIARYHRLAGDDVHFLIGMDEHGQKVAQTAADRKVAPQELVDAVADSSEEIWRLLGISYDQFIRTTDPAHKAGVRRLIEQIFENSPEDFYEKSYAGWYCVGCEAFKQENEIVDGKCILHPTRTLEWVEEKNWFFRLSAYSDRLRTLVASDEFLQPRTRRNEVLSLIDSGLEDVSASRSRFSWGVPFPRKGSAGDVQTTYVWFDALPNYLTATGFPNPDYETLWPADLHVIGKDITRFHALIWPAMLMAAGIQVPKRIWVHGFVLVGGTRVSKSVGGNLELRDAISRFGPDAFRYFLLREVPFDGDGNFSWERFEERYNSDLANAFGNLASRTISMVERYCAGVVPAGRRNDIDDADKADLETYHASIGGSKGFLLHEALRAVWLTVARANEYVDRQAPWKLAKDPALRAELESTLASLVRQLARQAVYLWPFIPKKSEELWKSLGAPGTPLQMKFTGVDKVDPVGWKVAKGTSLFPKAEPSTGQ
ncbi:MAG TPA: class I tRNA ligase family protein [Gemmatimonadaceae bacterium]|nr:class I tRNA ligase family protein [Gemmatimonadaceae bacterium]